MHSKFSSGHIFACYKGLGHYHLDGANLQMQTHLVPKNAAKIFIFLQQAYYSQIGFIVLVSVKLRRNYLASTFGLNLLVMVIKHRINLPNKESWHCREI